MIRDILSNSTWQGIAGIVAIIALLVTIWVERDKFFGFGKNKKVTEPIIIEPRTFQILLDHVESFWIKGILEKSLHGVALMELGMQEDRQAVNYPWTVRREVSNEPIPPNKDMLGIFQDVGMGRSMLILGEPGSGKTTMLLELGCQLIDLARQNDNKPIPIILNLSSWSEKQSINEWLTEQLNTFYKVDKKVAQALVETNAYMLLLDGLDEAKKELRNDCIKAINDFRRERGLIRITVCCRIEEYTELDNKLEFEGAIVIQPLIPEKVDEYFDRFGNRLAGIRYLLGKDTVLQELTQTPLMLSVMTLAFMDTPSDDIQVYGDIETQRKHIFDTYINRMFERPGRSHTGQFSKEKTVHWLSCLAQKMINHNEVPFLIERLQLNWLDNDRQQRAYIVSLRVIVGLFAGLYFGLYFEPIFGLFAGLVVWLFVGLAFGLFDWGVSPERIEPSGILLWSWKKFTNNLIKVVRKNLVVVLVLGLFAGLAFGLVRGLLAGLLFGLFVGLFVGLYVGLAGGLLGGLSSGQIEKTSLLNQNIKLSTRNFQITFLVVGLVGGLFFGLLFGLAGGLYAGLFFGSVIGLFSGLFFGLFSGGGISVIQHYLLRYFIAFKNNNLPWDLDTFLEQASDLIFLRRIGGGYIFIHRLLMEHFANMEA